MTLPPVEKVVVVGASGAVGVAIVQALYDAKFKVTVLTRSSPKKAYPSSVKVIQTDYTQDSLLQAFHDQDAVVSALGAASATLQQTMIDAAISCKVRHFIPSEYGVDTSSEAAVSVLPALKPKVEVVNQLRTQEDKITWTALVTGCLFDWCFDHPPFGGWSIKSKEATVYDGGDVPFEATTLPQVGRAIVAILRNQDLAANKYVYINSFTTTQNQVLNSFERNGSGKWAIVRAKTESTWQEGMELLQKGPDRMLGVVKIITAAFYDYGDLNSYSSKQGLWNERLGLPSENLDTATAAILTGVSSSL